MGAHAESPIDFAFQISYLLRVPLSFKPQTRSEVFFQEKVLPLPLTTVYELLI